MVDIIVPGFDGPIPTSVYILYTGSIENEAVYLQDEWKFDDRWTLISGLRYDKPSNNTKVKDIVFSDDSPVDDELITEDMKYLPETDFDSNISKSFNLAYKFNEDTNMYVAYNDYFILQSMYELYSTEYGNATLLPEKGKNYEVGMNHMLDNRTLMTLHYFKRDSDQNIGFDVDDEVYINDVEKSHGWDIQFDRRIDDNWSANIGYSRLSYAGAKGDNGTAGYLPKNSVTAGVTYSDAKWNVGVDARGFIGRLGAFKDWQGNDITKYCWPSDNYWVFNLSANYAPDDNIKVFAKCNNLFDKTYAEQTDVFWKHPVGSNAWYGAPGRNFVVGVEYSF